jgi:hypothetical protein
MTALVMHVGLLPKGKELMRAYGRVHGLLWSLFQFGGLLLPQKGFTGREFKIRMTERRFLYMKALPRCARDS